MAGFKCLVVDDHPIVRQGICTLLGRTLAGATVAEAASASAALTAIQREPWDLLVLDIALPDKHGLEVLKEAKLLRPTLPVLMLSLYPEREFALRALKAGAAGYLSKDRDPDELIQAVKAVLTGGRYITPSLAEQLALHMTGQRALALHEGLSDRELEVLRLLGQGKTVSGIAEKLALSVKTVSTYRTRLLEKLRLQTTAELVRYAIEAHLTA
ncbi:MAG: response regulator transcription factor [Nitrospira sp.]|nr:response regulator transcription factor [Nitrospira sp.]